jgi:hypothetical protein
MKFKKESPKIREAKIANINEIEKALSVWYSKRRFDLYKINFIIIPPNIA